MTSKIDYETIYGGILAGMIFAPAVIFAATWDVRQSLYPVVLFAFSVSLLLSNSPRPWCRLERILPEGVSVFGPTLDLLFVLPSLVTVMGVRFDGAWMVQTASIPYLWGVFFYTLYREDARRGAPRRGLLFGLPLGPESVAFLFGVVPLGVEVLEHSALKGGPDGLEAALFALAHFVLPYLAFVFVLSTNCLNYFVLFPSKRQDYYRCLCCPQR